MGNGYAVDLSAMQATVEGIQQTLRTMTVTPVGGIAAPTARVGHDGLTEALTGFCRRWDPGVGHLRDDAGELVRRLQQAIAAYRAAEQDAGAAARGAAVPGGTLQGGELQGGTLQGSGPDPAAAG